MGWGIFHLFETQDNEQVFIGVTSNAHWERFCAILGLAEMYADERLTTNEKRVQAQEWMLPKIRDAVASITSADLQAKLLKASVPYAPLRRPDQLLDDPHLKESGQLMTVPMEDGKFGDLPKLPFKSNSYEFTLRRGAPGLGADTREVLAEAGIANAEIDALIAAKAIAQG
jgi:crotonobetainyl-CoA:carnitine CoA-transferase CaiB-like acyl-CoA transferase